MNSLIFRKATFILMFLAIGCASQPCIERKATSLAEDQHAWIYYLDSVSQCPSAQKLDFLEFKEKLSPIPILEKKKILNPNTKNYDCEIPVVHIEIILIDRVNLDQAIAKGFALWQP